METYTGIKFKYVRNGITFDFDQQLTELNNWAFIFSGLGLTPVHPGGAYGNQSYRVGGNSFIITKSGMTPKRDFSLDNYVLIEGFDHDKETFFIKGLCEPSSESLLHFSIYRAIANVGAVLHGHSKLFQEYAGKLAIPVTPTFNPYGTFALADSAVKLLQTKTDLIQLKDHGFVAIGKDIQTAGNLVLDYYQRLIVLLKK
jgi:L-ribulose-5-phosphate 4-epimerase